MFALEVSSSVRLQDPYLLIVSMQQVNVMASQTVLGKKMSSIVVSIFIFFNHFVVIRKVK